MTNAEIKAIFGLSHMTTPKDTPPKTPQKASQGPENPETPETGKTATDSETAKTTTSGARSSVDSSDGPSFIAVPDLEGKGLVVQEHGGALLPGGTLEGSARGGRGGAERRRARAERSEAVDDAFVGHVEKMSDIIADLVEQASGEQHRCPNCGVLGPKVPKLKLKEATEVAGILMRAVKQPDAATTVVPIQVNVYSHAPLVAGQVADSGPQEV